MSRIKEMKNKYYGVADLFGANGKEIQGKAWKATVISSGIYVATLGACALVDKVFTEKHQKELREEIDLYRNDDTATDKVSRTIDLTDKYDKKNKLITSIIGGCLGVAGAVMMFKVQEKK